MAGRNDPRYYYPPSLPPQAPGRVSYDPLVVLPQAPRIDPPAQNNHYFYPDDALHQQQQPEEDDDDDDDEDEDEGDDGDNNHHQKATKKSWRNYPRHNFNKSEGRRRLKASSEALSQAERQLETTREALKQAERLHEQRLEEHRKISHQVVDDLLEAEKPRPWNKIYFLMKEFHRQHGHCWLSVRASTLKRKLDKQKKKKKSTTNQKEEDNASGEKQEETETTAQNDTEGSDRTNDNKSNDKDENDKDDDAESPDQDDDKFDAEQIGILGRWAAGQRNHRKKGKLEEWKVIALDRLGFVWDAREAAWHEMYQELKQYHAQHGHIRVLEKENQSLNRWLRFQRDNYRDFQNNGFVETRDDGVFGMNQERCDLLEALGIDWRIYEERWIVLYRKLKEVYEAQGHLRTLPTTGKNAGKLREFCSKQRQAYKVYLETGGRDCALISTEQVMLLEYIEFPWDQGDLLVQSEEEWMEDFKRVKAFFEKHQHFRYDAEELEEDDAKKLQAWDRCLRQQYKRLSTKIGKSKYTVKPLTPERLELLNAIGFFSEARNKKRSSSSDDNNQPRKRGRPRKIRPEETQEPSADGKPTGATNGKSGASNQSTDVKPKGAPKEKSGASKPATEQLTKAMAAPPVV